MCITGLQPPILLCILLAILTTHVTPCLATSDAWIYVRVRSASLADWQHADGVPGRRFIDEVGRTGSLIPETECGSELRARLESLASAAGSDLLCSGCRPFLAPGGMLWMGPPEAGLWVRDPSGSGADGRSPSAISYEDLGETAKLWCDREPRMRWEEVVEVLDLSTAENLSFRLSDAEPWRALRNAYIRDKAAANLAIYLTGRSRPRLLALSLELPRVFADDLRPRTEAWTQEARPLSGANDLPPRWTPPLHADEARRSADRRFLAARVRGSEDRIYGRVDRILQSLFIEAEATDLLLVDARGGTDGFVAVLGQRLSEGEITQGKLVDRLVGLPQLSP